MRLPLPLVTAHSGCLGSPPNGSLHIERALAAGADVIELDLRLSADGEVVLAHDEAVGSPGGARLRIATNDRAGLSEAARAAGRELLSLGEALDLLEGSQVLVNLDAKEASAAFAAAPLLRRRGWIDRVIISGLEAAAARELRSRFPDLRCLLNADGLLPVSGYGPEGMRAAAAVLTESGCCGLNLDWKAATPELLAYTRPRCIPVLLWTIDAEEDLRAALDLGPWSITTHRPDILARLLGEGNRQGRQP